MTLFQFYDSFFGVRGSTPYARIKDDIKRDFHYLLVNRLTFSGNDMYDYMLMYGIDTAILTDMLYKQYGNVGYIPKWVFTKINTKFDKWWTKNEKKLSDLFALGMIEGYENMQDMFRDFKQSEAHHNEKITKLLRKKIKVA